MGGGREGGMGGGWEGGSEAWGMEGSEGWVGGREGGKDLSL